jgi:hypothetical protein
VRRKGLGEGGVPSPVPAALRTSKLSGAPLPRLPSLLVACVVRRHALCSPIAQHSSPWQCAIIAKARQLGSGALELDVCIGHKPHLKSCRQPTPGE